MARNGASKEVCDALEPAFSDDFGMRMLSPRKAMTISPATPRNGPRQEMAPSHPPTSGPTEMPRPTAASYKMTALAVPLPDKVTMADKAVATNKALPSPQPPRSPMIVHTSPAMPPSAENTAITMMPASRVHLMPMREEIAPVISMATAITAL
ncbi:hypothetical protein D3C76_1274740 [compost metagenome]